MATAAVAAAALVGPLAPSAAAATPTGAAATGVYTDLFAQAGYSNQAVNAKLDAAVQQLFHGAPGTAPDYFDGQTILYHPSPGMAYVTDVANHDVRTEGIGYAMMIALQVGDKSDFNGLWNFAKTYMQIKTGPEQNFFAWHVKTDGSALDQGVAPDGDQWIAAALAFASARWGNGTGKLDYKAQSRAILHAMWHQSDTGGVDMFDRTTYLPTFSPPWAVAYSDPSYALPAFYRTFAAIDPTDADLWNHAVVAGEQLLQNAHNVATGLTPDYANFDGSPHFNPGETPSDDSYTHNFQEDAWRAIANTNLDADWYGVKSWQRQYSNQLESFFVKRGVSSYVSRYHLDGTPLATGQNTYEPAHAQGLVAMNSTSAMTSTNAHRMDFVRDFWNTAVPSGRARYYDGMLYLLGMLYDSGKFKVWTAPAAS
ncbi:glycosyl hydrolase family 8 [Jatrophihabitans sp. YIM 134969]